MTLTEIIFATLVTITLTGAVLAVTLKNVFYNALSLILCLFGVAAIFIYLNSEFLAIMEVIVYIGAISIAIIFAIMLSRPMLQTHEHRNIGKAVRSAILGALLFGALAKLIYSTTWTLGPEEGDYSIRNIGKMLLSTQAVPFEVISVILLIAIIGALVLSSSGENAS